MAKFDPEIHDNNPPMDTAFMAGMKPSSRGRPKLETPKVEVKSVSMPRRSSICGVAAPGGRPV